MNKKYVLLAFLLILFTLSLTAGKGLLQQPLSSYPAGIPASYGQMEPVDLSILPPPIQVPEPASVYGNTDRSAIIGERLTKFFFKNRTFVRTISVNEKPGTISVDVRLSGTTNPYNLTKSVGNLTHLVQFYYSLTPDQADSDILLTVHDGRGKLLINAKYLTEKGIFAYYYVLDERAASIKKTAPASTQYRSQLQVADKPSYARQTSSGQGSSPQSGWVSALGGQDQQGAGLGTGNMKPLSPDRYPVLPMKKLPKPQYGNTTRSQLIAEEMSSASKGKVGVKIDEIPGGNILVDMHFKYYDVDRILSLSSTSVYYIHWLYHIIGLGDSDIIVKTYGPNDRLISCGKFSGQQNRFIDYRVAPFGQAQYPSAGGIPQGGSGGITTGNITAQNVVQNIWYSTPGGPAAQA